MERQDDSILEEFLVECGENLDQLERDLIALEGNPASVELLARSLRALHTIKGTCGFFGFTRLQALTHAAEGLLGRYRDGGQRIDDRVCSLLLATLDDARRIVRTIASQRHEGGWDPSPRIEELRALQDRDAPAATGAAGAPTAPGSGTPRLLAPLIESGRLSAAAAEAAERRQQQGDPRRIGEILIEEGALQPEEVIDALVTREANQRSGNDGKVRVDVEVLDRLMNLASELVMTRNQVLQGVAAQDVAALVGPSHRLDRITSRLQAEIMQTRMRPVGQLWDMLPRLARDVAGVCGKQVRLELDGTDTELDRTVLEAIRDPLMHLVRNAISHGIEAPEARAAAGKPREGRVHLGARHQGGQVLIEVADDGGGISVERIRRRAEEQHLVRSEDVARMTAADWHALIFVRGLSTAESVTAVSGRGIGMDVVKANIERIGGTVEVRSEPGRGTTFVLRLPLTLAIVPALIVIQDGERYAIPRASIQELLQLRAGGSPPPVEWVGRLPFHRLRGQLLSLIRLSDVLGTSTTELATMDRARELQVVVVRAEGYAFGLAVDAIHDAEEIVVKPLDDPFKGVPAFAGATLLGDGRVAVILDMSGIGRSVRLECAPERAATEDPEVAAPPRARQALLLVRAGDDWHAAIPSDSITRLEEVPVASIEHTRGGDVFQYRGRIMPLVGLAGLLDSTAGTGTTDEAKVPVLVFERDGRVLGLVVREVLDIVEPGPDTEPVHGRPGVCGASVIWERVTDHLDIESLLDVAFRRTGPDESGSRAEAA